MKNTKLIIWDWNGTLLDDMNACISSMNLLLKKRNIPHVNHEKYRNIFSFPVKEYYVKLGFDLNTESFEELSGEYISLYKEESKRSSLQIGAIKVLDYFKMKNFKQIIISAMEQDSLENQVRENEIYHYFKNIIGLNNIYAKSKIEIAKDFFNNNNKLTNEENCFLIGDTYHDYEVSMALNCKCILVNNGHQDLSRFKMNENVKIINNLLEIIEENIIG